MVAFRRRAGTGALVLLAAALAACTSGYGPGEGESATAPAAGAVDSTQKVFFTEPDDGATMPSPVKVTMDSNALNIEPAGLVRVGSGHFHIMVDVGCVAPGTVIPNDATHLHFGKAQRETSIELPAGPHTLCLQAGDGAHTALDLTDELKVTVQ